MLSESCFGWLTYSRDEEEEEKSTLLRWRRKRYLRAFYSKSLTSFFPTTTSSKVTNFVVLFSPSRSIRLAVDDDERIFVSIQMLAAKKCCSMQCNRKFLFLDSECIDWGKNSSVVFCGIDEKMERKYIVKNWNLRLDRHCMNKWWSS